MDVTPVEIKAAFRKVPHPIREFISEGKLADSSKLIGEKYGLHVDVIGSLNQVMTLVLLGFINPAGLPKQLSDNLHIDTSQISDLIRELNTSIFIPLQKQVREFGPEPTHEERIRESAPATTTVPSYRTQTPQPQVAPLKVETRAVEFSQPISTPTPTPSFNLARPDALVPVTTPHGEAIRTMQSDMRAVQEGHSTQSVSIEPQPMHATPSRSFQTASIPVPAHMFEQPKMPQAPVFASAPVPQQPVQAPITPPVPQIPLSKQYGSDPYREPI